MIRPNNYPVIFLLKFVLIGVFTNIYRNIYKDTNTSFLQRNSEARITADSAELNLIIKSDSIILVSYKEYRDILKVQKSVVDNVYNKLKNTNSNSISQFILERPEHKAIAYIRSLRSNSCYGDVMAIVKDTCKKKNFNILLRQPRQTFLLDYYYKRTHEGDLATALDKTRLAIDYDRDLCNKVITNAEDDIKSKKSTLNVALHRLNASGFDFVIFAATIEFTFNYTDILPSSSKVSLLCLIHKILAGFLYFILINQLKKKFFP